MSQFMLREWKNPIPTKERFSKYRHVSQYSFVIETSPSMKPRPVLNSEDIQRWSQKHIHHDRCMTDSDLISIHVVPETTELFQFEQRLSFDHIYERILSCDENFEESEMRHDLEALEVFEETLTGEDAVRFHELLMNPPHNPRKEKMIAEALRQFPNPDEPTELDIDL